MIESEPLQDGRNMVMMLGPVKQALPKQEDEKPVEGPTSLASLAGDIINEDDPVAEPAPEPEPEPAVAAAVEVAAPSEDDSAK